MPPPPPPASGIASRFFLGPALRAQPDRRLVGLVRDGYENAFEEIVRRYGGGLRRYAAAIVPSHRADDVTQDAFQKALLALRSAEADVELRPWLFRIVRNTALNDLRDQPPPAGGVPEYLPGPGGPAEAAERREEIADLLRRLQALPDPQRAAIVMRELEGLSHEEIAAALGVTDGAARQMLYRARQTLREAGAVIVPLPVLHFLLEGDGGRAIGEAAAGAGLGAATAAGATTGGGTALKAGVATVLVAGSVSAGVVVSERQEDPRRAATVEIADRGGREDGGDRGADAQTASLVESGGGEGNGSEGSGGGEEGDDRSGRSGEDREAGERDAEDSGGGDNSGPSGHGGRGHDPADHPGPGGGGAEPDGADHSGPGGGGGGHSGPGGGEAVELPNPPDIESPNSGPGSTSSGSGSSGSGSSAPGSGSSGSGSDSSGSGSSGSGSGSSGSGSGSSGSGSGYGRSGSGGGGSDLDFEPVD